MTTPEQLKVYLDSQSLEPTVRKNVWDHFSKAQDPDDFKARFDEFENVPKEVKRDLWDARWKPGHQLTPAGMSPGPSGMIAAEAGYVPPPEVPPPVEPVAGPFVGPSPIAPPVQVGDVPIQTEEQPSLREAELGTDRIAYIDAHQMVTGESTEQGALLRPVPDPNVQLPPATGQVPGTEGLGLLPVLPVGEGMQYPPPAPRPMSYTGEDYIPGISEGVEGYKEISDILYGYLDTPPPGPDASWPEAVADGFMRLVIGINTPEAVAMIIGGAGLAAAAPQIAAIPRVAKYLLDKPHVAKGMEIASEAAAPGAFAGVIGAGAAAGVPSVVEQYQEGNIPGAISAGVQVLGGAALAGMAGKHAVTRGKEALGRFPKEKIRAIPPRKREGLEGMRPEGYQPEPRIEPVKGAAEKAAQYEAEGRLLPAQEWAKLTGEKTTGEPIDIVVGGRPARIEFSSVQGKTAPRPVRSREGTEAPVKELLESTQLEPASGKLAEVRVVDASGKVIYSGRAVDVQNWLRSRKAKGTADIIEAKAKGEAEQLAESAREHGEHIEIIREHRKKREANYDTIREWAAEQPSFGKTKLESKFGIPLDDAQPILDRLVEDGAVTAKPQPTGQVFYSRTKKPDDAEDRPQVQEDVDVYSEDVEEALETPEVKAAIEALPSDELPDVEPPKVSPEFPKVSQGTVAPVAEPPKVAPEKQPPDVAPVEEPLTFEGDGASVKVQRRRDPQGKPADWMTVLTRGDISTPAKRHATKEEAISLAKSVTGKPTAPPDVAPVEEEAAVEAVEPTPATKPDLPPVSAPESTDPAATKPEQRDYSSTQVNLPDDAAASVKQAAAKIADEDLAPDGREDQPHITVKYGLHTEDAEEVRKIVESEPPITAKLGKTSLFPDRGDGEVVKVDIESEDLRRINKKIADALEVTDTYPDYNPHVTLAYVKPGKGDKYSGLSDLEGTEITFDQIAFSGKDGSKVEIELKGKPAPTEAEEGVVELKGEAAKETPETAPKVDEKKTPQPPAESASLPQSLAGAKPRYAFGSRQFTLSFESDLDRAAYITAQSKPSKRDAEYLSFAMEASGLTEEQVRAHGQRVRTAIKEQARDAKAGELKVARINPPAPTTSARGRRAAQSKRESQRGAIGLRSKETFPKLKLSNERAQAQMELAAQDPEGDKFAEALEKLKTALPFSKKSHWVRQFESLEKGKYPELDYETNRFLKTKGVARHKAAMAIVELVDQMSKNEYETFAFKIGLDDLVARIRYEEKQGREIEGDDLPFDFESVEEVIQARDEVTAHANRSPLIKEALQNRKRIQAETKRDLIKESKLAGMTKDLSETLSRDDYYHHRVLSHMEDRYKGEGKGVKLSTGRGWLKASSVNQAAYSLDWIQSEFEVLDQMMRDTMMARYLAWIRESPLNIASDLKSRARLRNDETIMPFFEALAKKANKDLAEGAEELTAMDMYRSILNKKIAIAISKFKGLAGEGNLPEFRQFDDVLEALVSGESANVTPYAAWILKTADPEIYGEARGAAAQLLKGISEKKDKIKQLADKKWVNPNPSDLATLINAFGIRDGYEVYQPDPGSIFYSTHSVAEDLAEKILASDEGEFVLADDIKKLRAIGRKKLQFVIPTDVADMLREIGKTREPPGAWEKAHKMWKQAMLLLPHRVLKYWFRNVSGDSEAIFIGNPRAFKKMPRAIRELYSYFKENKMTPEISEYFDLGALDSLLLSQEVEDINRLEELDHLLHKSKTDRPKPLRWIWRKIKLGNNFREAILRYAAYLDYKEQMKNNNGIPRNFGASVPERVMALPKIPDRAYKLSNDLLGAYDEISVTGSTLRRLWYPFWSFQEINMKRYWNLMRNAIRNDAYAMDVGTRTYYKVTGGAGGKGKKVARLTAGTALKIGRWTLTVLAFRIAFEAWNHLKHGDIEKTIPEHQRKNAHIILWGGDKPIIFTNMGTLDDFMGWIPGLEVPWAYVFMALNGRRTFEEIVTEMGKEVVNEKIVGGMGQAKIFAELLTGTSVFPDVFKPGSIQNRFDHHLRPFGLEWASKLARGAPQEKFNPLKLAKNWAAYEVDPGKTAYYATRDEVNRYLNKEGGGGWSFSEKSNALYDIKLAIRFGYDDEEVKGYIQKYINLGGKVSTIQGSLNSLHPLNSVPKKKRAAFKKTLNGEQLHQLEMGVQYWRDVLKGDVSRIRRIGENLKKKGKKQ